MSSEETIIQCPICKEKIPQGYILCPFCGADITVSYEEEIYSPVLFKDVWRRIFSLISSPKSIIEEINDNPDIKAAFYLMLIIPFGMSLQIFAYMLHMRSLEWGLSFFIPIIMYILSFLLPLVVWFFGSIIIRNIGRLIGGTATKKQIRAATGYALMPAAIGEILVGLIYLILLPWFNPEIQNFQETFSAVNYIRNSFFGMTGLIIRLIEILACGVYLIIMVKYANEFNWFEAIITTSIPILLFFFLVLSYYFL